MQSQAQENNSAPRISRRPDFHAAYANNVAFNWSDWDLSLLFGELTDAGGIDQHTRVTVSWLQAKVMALFLLINIEAHENKTGRIEIPPFAIEGTLPEGRLERVAPILALFGIDASSMAIPAPATVEPAAIVASVVQ